jgi:predicted  nucleic acid-binding Zn-ribbon protein
MISSHQEMVIQDTLDKLDLLERETEAESVYKIIDNAISSIQWLMEEIEILEEELKNKDNEISELERDVQSLENQLEDM